MRQLLWTKRFLLISMVVVHLAVEQAVAKDEPFEPYSVLGVHKRATQQDIRNAYKKMARKWHPDKVLPEEKPEAERQFIKVNRAYELLSDPERRRQFDNYGVTEDKPNFRKNPRDEYASYGRFDPPFDSFHEFFSCIV